MIIVANIRVGLNATTECVSEPAFLRRVVDHVVASDTDQTLIIVGSLTATADPGEFAVVKRIFAELVAAGVTVIAVPGNRDHAIGVFGGKTAPSKVKLLHDTFEPLRAQPNQIASGGKAGVDSITIVGDDIFVTCACAGGRLGKKQVRWAKGQLQDLRLADPRKRRLHFVTHDSLWQGKRDRHAPLVRSSMLQKELLRAFGFTTFVHGHNNRFLYDRKAIPAGKLVLRRISIPTLNALGKHHGSHAQGYLACRLPRLATVPPSLVHLQQSHSRSEQQLLSGAGIQIRWLSSDSLVAWTHECGCTALRGPVALAAGRWHWQVLVERCAKGDNTPDEEDDADADAGKKSGTGANAGAADAATAALMSALSIGVVEAQSCLGTALGTDAKSWGYTVDGHAVHGGAVTTFRGNANGSTLALEDGSVVDVLLDFGTGTLSLAVDDVPLGVVFSGLRGKVLYPAVGLVRGSRVRLRGEAIEISERLEVEVERGFLNSIDPDILALLRAKLLQLTSARFRSGSNLAGERSHALARRWQDDAAVIMLNDHRDDHRGGGGGGGGHRHKRSTSLNPKLMQHTHLFEAPLTTRSTPGTRAPRTRTLAPRTLGTSRASEDDKNRRSPLRKLFGEQLVHLSPAARDPAQQAIALDAVSHGDTLGTANGTPQTGYADAVSASGGRHSAGRAGGGRRRNKRVSTRRRRRQWDEDLRQERSRWQDGDGQTGLGFGSGGAGFSGSERLSGVGGIGGGGGGGGGGIGILDEEALRKRHAKDFVDVLMQFRRTLRMIRIPANEREAADERQIAKDLTRESVMVGGELLDAHTRGSDSNQDRLDSLRTTLVPRIVAKLRAAIDTWLASGGVDAKGAPAWIWEGSSSSSSTAKAPSSSSSSGTEGGGGGGGESGGAAAAASGDGGHTSNGDGKGNTKTRSRSPSPSPGSYGADILAAAAGNAAAAAAAAAVITTGATAGSEAPVGGAGGGGGAEKVVTAAAQNGDAESAAAAAAADVNGDGKPRAQEQARDSGTTRAESSSGSGRSLGVGAGSGSVLRKAVVDRILERLLPWVLQAAVRTRHAFVSYTALCNLFRHEPRLVILQLSPTDELKNPATAITVRTNRRSKTKAAGAGAGAGRTRRNSRSSVAHSVSKSRMLRNRKKAKAAAAKRLRESMLPGGTTSNGSSTDKDKGAAEEAAERARLQGPTVVVKNWNIYKVEEATDDGMEPLLLLATTVTERFHLATGECDRTLSIVPHSAFAARLWEKRLERQSSRDSINKTLPQAPGDAAARRARLGRALLLESFSSGGETASLPSEPREDEELAASILDEDEEHRVEDDDEEDNDGRVKTVSREGAGAGDASAGGGS